MGIMSWLLGDLYAELAEIRRKEDEIMATLNELTGIITEVSTQLAKAKDEIVAKIAALEAALANVELPADAQAAIDALKAQAQALDDVVPDVPA